MPEDIDSETPRTMKRTKQKTLRNLTMPRNLYHRVSFLESKEDIYALSELSEVSGVKGII